MNNYGYDDVDFTKYALPDFTGSTFVDVVEDEETLQKDNAGLKKRLIAYPLLLLVAIVVGHVGGAGIFAYDAYSTGLLSLEDLISFKWYFGG